jgi:hypothetical protein
LKIKVVKDGNSYCAFDENRFRNLQESISGWGNTPDEAIVDLKQRMGITDAN